MWYHGINKQHSCRSNKGVVFLATPHTGSDIASFLRWIGPAIKVSETVGELKKNNAMLRDLAIWYRENVPDRNVKHGVLYETQSVRGLPVLVVGQDAADPGLPGVIPIPVGGADHIWICKLNSKDDLVYRSVKQFIEDNLDPTRPPYPGTFFQLTQEFAKARRTNDGFEAFKKERIGQKVKGTAVVLSRETDKKKPKLRLIPADTVKSLAVMGASEVGWLAPPAVQFPICGVAMLLAKKAPTTILNQVNFATFFSRNLPDGISGGAWIEIEGVLGKNTNIVGLILEECKIHRIIQTGQEK
jgi:hypothetical protein